MALDKISIPKLKGSENYPIWVIRMSAILVKEGQNSIITTDDVSDDINARALSNIQLCIDDGPLLQIQNITRAYQAWLSLKNLYSPKGFSSEFLICKEFFETDLHKYPSMEEYLNKIKQLSDQLKAKNLELPKQVIIAWVLNNLTNNYDGLVSNITQSLRTNIESYSIESLFSNLLDESKRQESMEANNNSQALYIMSNKGKYKGKKPYKVTKGRFCRNCKQTSHDIKDCYFLFPDKAPKSWKNYQEKAKKASTEQEKEEKSARDIRDDNINVLYSNMSPDALTSLGDMEIDFDIENIQVNITQNVPNTLNTNINLDVNSQVLVASLNSTNFILDTAATKHIICDKSFFSDFRECNKTVNWGQAKSIAIKGIGNVYIKFKNYNKAYMLKDCLYMPELGINLIS